MALDNFIKVYDDALNPNFCENLIDICLTHKDKNIKQEMDWGFGSYKFNEINVNQDQTLESY